MTCGVGCRHDSDPASLWLWCRPAATAPFRPLAWEPSYAAGAALEKDKKKFFFNKNLNIENIFVLLSSFWAFFFSLFKAVTAAYGSAQARS